MRLNVLGLRNNSGEGKQLEELITTFLKMSSKEQMQDFLQGILTPKELLEIPNRLKIVKLLKKGVSHHDIADKMHVGVSTVTRGSRELQKGRFSNV